MSRRFFDSKKRHLMFVGRWITFHDGHKYIIRQKHEEKQLPVLILVRDTDESPNALTRKWLIIDWLEAELISGRVIIIPDIEGIYYGRDVGYTINEIVVPQKIADISGTKLRAKQK